MAVAGNNKPAEIVLPAAIKDLLPEAYSYYGVSYQVKPSFSNEPRFTCTFRVSINSKEEVKYWLKKFQEISYTTWRVRKTFPEYSDRLIYKIVYRCHHNTIPHSHSHVKVPHEKHTSCSSKLHITVQRALKGSKDKNLVWTFPCLISISHEHNHLIYAAEALKHRDPSPEVRAKFVSLFSCHTPSSALEVHRQDLHLQYNDDFFPVESDRSINPDRFWVYHLYYSTFEESYGKGHGVQMLQNLGQLIENYNSEVGFTCAKMQYDENCFAIAVCTPFMQRVQETLPTAAELICCDSSGGMDRFQCRVFLLMVHSSIGGLPLGVLITSSESEQVPVKALNLFKDLLRPCSFYGRGTLGPAVFMTDDSAGERNSLRISFPDSTLILCVFHVLQAAWRYIWDAKSSVHKDDKVTLFSFVKELVYCRSKEELDEKYEERIGLEIVQKCDRFRAYYEKLYDRKEEWAICYRDDLMIRGHITNNIDGAAMRVLKDKILLRTKAYNVLQLFSFLTEDLDKYYERKIHRMISGRPDQRMKLNFINLGEKAQRIKVTPTDVQSVFEVHSLENNQQYIVDVKSESCSCPIGLNGGACKHQFAVFKQQKIPTMQFLPASSSEKMVFHFIATGQRNVPKNWYADLQGSNAVSSKPSCSADKLNNHEAIPHIDVQNDTSGTSEPMDYLDNIAEAERLLNGFYDEVLCKIRQYPDQFCAAIIKGMSNFEQLKTDAAKVSALTTIGNYSGGGFPQRSGRKGRSIPVQSTALARRVKKIGGRKYIVTGRPPKSMYVREHGYNKYKANSLLMPKRRELRVPHTLSHCVSLNVALGKTHSAKI